MQRGIIHQFKRYPIGVSAFILLSLFAFTGLYAPFLASSKPLFVVWNDHFYFPLFRYLFFTGFYTKNLDIFYNILMFSLPIMLIFYKKKRLLIAVIALHFILFFFLIFSHGNDPKSNENLNQLRHEKLQTMDKSQETWDFTLEHMTSYAKLEMVQRYRHRLQQDKNLQHYAKLYAEKTKSTEPMPTLYQVDLKNYHRMLEQTQDALTRQYLIDKHEWLIKENAAISTEIMPLVRHFHWEDDAGGEQNINKYISWWELSRINRKDLVASLIFGIRISLMVGITAVAIQMLIGIPIGALSGYFGGKVDIITNRILEVWEGIPTFFLLLLVVAITHNKSIFLVISILGLFGWTGFARFIRGETLKQRHLPYIDACRSLGLTTRKIVFSHILPNAIPPVITLLPFAILSAITSEAGLSFLGLGEEGSASWGILMDEGREAFPGESYLLWPPALLLTILLISIALIGDALRDAIDPKLKR